MAKVEKEVVVKFTMWYWVLRAALYFNSGLIGRISHDKPIAKIDGSNLYMNYENHRPKRNIKSFK